MRRSMNTLRSFPRPVGFCVVLCLGVVSASWPQMGEPIRNISPTQSNRDSSDPNSASGGRVNLLAAHPTNTQIFFAASEWGGLFQTRDQGRNWDYVPGHVPQAMWDVKFDPSDGDVLIATSFFDGKVNSLSGINLSRDGGQTWAVPATSRPAVRDCAIASAAREPAAFGIAVDPEDPDTIYVGTNCGLAISEDSGRTWNHVDPTPGDGGGLNVYGVIVHNDGIVDVCGDDGHQRSIDGGTTFRAGATEAGGRCSLAVSPDEQNVLFMTIGTAIFESRDGGGSWPNTLVNPDPQGRIPFVKVNDRSGRNYDLWFGDTRLYRASCTTPSRAGSTARRCPRNSWSRQQTGAHWDVGDLVFDVAATSDACPVLFSNDGGVYFNRRTGSDCHSPRWEQPDRSVSALWLWDMDGAVRRTAQEEGVYIGQQDTGAFGTRNAPANAPEWKSPDCCDGFDVEAEEGRVVYTICCFGGRATRMFRDDDSMDGGLQSPNYPAGNLFGFRDMDSLTHYAPDSYAVVTTAGAFFTTDMGRGTITWQSLGTGAPGGLCGLTSSQDAAGNPVFIGRAGGCGLGQSGALWRLDGATTTGAWRPIRRAGASQFGAFGVNPSTADHLIANDLSGAAPAMVRTRNGGTTWTVLTQLDTMLVGNGNFLAQTQAGARPGDAGYPQASMVVINPDDPDMIAVGGQDSGVFLSRDGGNSWRLLTDPYRNSPSRPHISRPIFGHFETFHNGHANLYVGTRGRGVFRIAVNRPTFVTSADLDGNGPEDIAIGSPWGIGTLEQNGTRLVALGLQPNGTRFDGWLLDTESNRLDVIANLDTTAQSEMLVASPWGLGVLRQSGNTYRALSLHPNGTRFGDWLLSTEDNRFGPAGDFDGDGQDEVLVTSPWGLGIFHRNGTTFDVPTMAPNGTRLGGWILDTSNNRFGPVGDFDNDGRDEIWVSSPWGIGVMDFEGTAARVDALKPNGTRVDGWLLSTAGNRFGPAGDFDADGQDEVLVRSDWGVGILEQDGTTFAGLMLRPNGTNFGGWTLDTTSDHSWGAGHFADPSRDDLFVAGLSGMAILRLNSAGQTLDVTARGHNGTRYGGWVLDTANNVFEGHHDLTGDNRADIVVTSPWGLGVLSQSGATWTSPLMERNGASLAGWRLDTLNNKLW